MSFTVIVSGTVKDVPFIELKHPEYNNSPIWSAISVAFVVRVSALRLGEAESYQRRKKNGTQCLPLSLLVLVSCPGGVRVH